MPHAASCGYGGDFTTTDGVHLSVTAFGLVITLSICIHAFRARSSWDNPVIKVLFFFSILQAVLYLSEALALNLNCLYPSPIPEWLFDALFCLTILSYEMLAHSLLTTLILRLHAFKHSALEITSTLRCTLLMLFIGVTLSGVAYFANVAFWYFELELSEDSWYDLDVVVTISWTMYWTSWFLTSFVAVAVFARNLYRLAMFTPPENVSPDRSIQLTGDQNKLIAVSSKYVSLFALAAVSTFTCVMVASVGKVLSWTNIGIAELEDNKLSLVIACDVVVNVVCLYLQYQFANKIYRRVCCGLDACCNRMMAKRMKKDVNRRHATLRSQTLPTISTISTAVTSPVAEVVSPQTPMDDVDDDEKLVEFEMTKLDQNTISIIESEDERCPEV